MNTNALDKIIKKIESSTEVEIKHLRAENEKQCCEIVKKKDKLIEAEKVRLSEKIELFKQNLNFKVDSENLIFKKNKILETKQGLILQVKKKVIETLCSDDAWVDRYFKFMERLIETNLSGENCVLIYGSLDYLRFLKNLKFKNEGFLKVEKSNVFDYGALICCDDFEINLSVNQLISDWFSIFKSEVLAILVQGEQFFEQV